MKTLRLILGDQLSETISSLEGYNPNTDIILMCEVWDEATYVKHHKKKIALLFSATRHFAKVLKHKGYQIEYTKLNDSENTGSFKNEVKRLLQKHPFDRIIVTYPGEYRVLEDIRNWKNE
jgi:deoxyribodipyrimidine photolyase-related protein